MLCDWRFSRRTAVTCGELHPEHHLVGEGSAVAGKSGTLVQSIVAYLIEHRICSVLTISGCVSGDLFKGSVEENASANLGVVCVGGLELYPDYKRRVSELRNSSGSPLPLM